MGVNNSEPHHYLHVISQSPSALQIRKHSLFADKFKVRALNDSITESWIQVELCSQRYIWSYLNDCFLKCFVPITFLKGHNLGKRKSPEMLDEELVGSWSPFPLYDHYLCILSGTYDIHMGYLKGAVQKCFDQCNSMANIRRERQYHGIGHKADQLVKLLYFKMAGRKSEIQQLSVYQYVTHFLYPISYGHY